MSIELHGNWKKGYAFDVHTLDSVYIGPDEHGHNQWKTTRSDMGELVYQLKYKGRQDCLLSEGGAKDVCVLTMTKTRSKR